MRTGGRWVMAAVALVACRDPTQMKLELTTDAKCADHRGTSITVGRLGSMEDKAPSAVTDKCDESGRIGSLVVVPSGDDDAEVAIRVVTGIAKTPDACIADGYVGGCIVARRALHYLPHETLYLPIAMTVDCADVECGVTETCYKGQCVPAKIDPSKCTDPQGCQPGSGGSAGAGGTGGSAGSSGAAGSGASGGAGGTGATGGVGGTGASGGVGGTGATGGAGGTGGVTCQPPLADCDQNAQNGCETDVSADALHCGACTVSCFGATCTNGSCAPTLIATTSNGATALASDATNVYWSDQGASAVRQAPLASGASAQTLATGQNLITGVAVDATHVYWATYTGSGRVARVPIGGGAVEIISPLEPFAAYVAVDATHVYWTAGNSQGVVRRAPKTGGSAETLATGQSFPWGIALDASDVFWTNWAANTPVFRVAKDGVGGPIAITQNEKTPYGIALYAGTVYFTLFNAQGQVRSVSASATDTASTLIAGGLSKPNSVAADASGVYWTIQGASVHHLPPGSSTPVTVASGVTGLMDVAVGPKAVCWATAAGPVCKGK